MSNKRLFNVYLQYFAIQAIKIPLIRIMPHRKNYSTKIWIDIHNEDEVLYFSKRFRTTPKELVDTVYKIGKTAKYVQLHFDRQAMNK